MPMVMCAIAQTSVNDDELPILEDDHRSIINQFIEICMLQSSKGFPLWDG